MNSGKTDGTVDLAIVVKTPEEIEEEKKMQEKQTEQQLQGGGQDKPGSLS